MACKWRIIFTLSLLYSVITIGSSKGVPYSNSNIDWWCNLAPHPEPCKYYLTKINNHGEIKHRSEFLTMLVQLALKQAVIMQSEAREFEQNMVTEKHKVVHNDCEKLYDNTIFHINRTLEGLHGKIKCSSVDVQTWLSTALTNIETCGTGVVELNVEDFIVSKLSSNTTKMISNSLAINMDFLKQNAEKQKLETKEAFPSWFSRHRRKLLQFNLTKKAHLVVARDGSGHFKNVQDALNAAAKRKIKTRFIIHVKKGVYIENIEVEKNNDNIMLVGKGMRNTIITSSRSFQDGFTTYSSATAGIDGLHFIARDITFRNTAGPRKAQAVALRSASDLSVFYRCAIIGYQDTLMADAQRQFYKHLSSQSNKLS